MARSYVWYGQMGCPSDHGEWEVLFFPRCHLVQGWRNLWTSEGPSRVCAAFAHMLWTCSRRISSSFQDCCGCTSVDFQEYLFCRIATSALPVMIQCCLHAYQCISGLTYLPKAHIIRTRGVTRELLHVWIGSFGVEKRFPVYLLTILRPCVSEKPIRGESINGLALSDWAESDLLNRSRLCSSKEQQEYYQ